jgi:hypothetical protein
VQIHLQKLEERLEANFYLHVVSKITSTILIVIIKVSLAVVIVIVYRFKPLIVVVRLHFEFVKISHLLSLESQII